MMQLIMRSIATVFSNHLKLHINCSYPLYAIPQIMKGNPYDDFGNSVLSNISK